MFPLCNIQCWTRIHDANSYVIASTGDADCDGTADNDCRSYERDAAGNAEREGIDPNCDGMPETCNVSEYDAWGYATNSYTDEACDGTPDRNCQFSSPDSTGTGTAIRPEPDCDGVATNCSVSGRDADGRLIFSRSDPRLRRRREPLHDLYVRRVRGRAPVLVNAANPYQLTTPGSCTDTAAALQRHTADWASRAPGMQSTNSGQLASCSQPQPQPLAK